MRNYFYTILDLDCIFRIIHTAKTCITEKFVRKESIVIEQNFKKKMQEN